MDDHTEFRQLLVQRQGAKREITRVEQQIQLFVTRVAGRQRLSYEACLQRLLQSVVDDECRAHAE